MSAYPTVVGSCLALEHRVRLDVELLDHRRFADGAVYVAGDGPERPRRLGGAVCASSAGRG